MNKRRGGAATVVLLVCSTLALGCSTSASGHLAVPSPSRLAGSPGQRPAPATSRSRAHDAAERCKAAMLRLQGGRESGGSHGFADANVYLTNTGQRTCRLSGTPPAVSIERSNGDPLGIQFVANPKAARRALLVRSGQRADLVLSWQSWCRPKPGPLRVAVRLPRSATTVTGSFDGPPGSNFVPGCLRRPSTVRVLDAYVR